jgi:hypothetical protein
MAGASSDVVAAIQAEVTAAGDQWPLLRAGLFSGSHARLMKSLGCYLQLLQQGTAAWL